jgi:pyruvate/2-oxoglutarate/acetoin dehydrogenase E1 component
LKEYGTLVLLWEIINAIRGIHVLVPRNMTKAAGFYNSLLECDEPALVIECLNGYRLKRKATQLW